MGVWLSEQEADFEEFVSMVSEPTRLERYPHASGVEQGIVIYDAATLPRATDPQARRVVMAEIADALLSGPGVVAVTGAFADTSVIDRASELFDAMIAEQHAVGRAIGDHFAKPGSNDRVWNTLQKHALRDPEGFVDYYSTDTISLVSTAWLGPGYQVTAAVNVVNPGGTAQVPHRDYHLGFMTPDQVERYPAHVHALSPVLTLQGAVAHVDMPLESGPTFFVPHSQKFLPGYLAWRRDDVKEYVAEHKVQIPLKKGDMSFFNPAVLHGAADNNSTDIRRMANLLQVSSVMGKAMEAVDREAMTTAVYPVLRERVASGMDSDLAANVLAATCDFYAFPTNLDNDPPIGGLAPASQGDIVTQALAESWTPDTLAAELAAHSKRRNP